MTVRVRPLSQALLEVDNLVRHYERPRSSFFSKKSIVTALNGVSFSVQRGESFGIVGESGAGKSTLARAILALEEPTSGSIRFRGEDLFDLPTSRKLAVRRHIQMVFQDPFATLDPKHKVLSVVGEPLALVDGVSAAERTARAEEALVDVGLDAGDLDKFPHQFSGGQRQRIAIARALIARPELIVVDEPVSALDRAMRMQILDLMTELQERFQLTYIIISHDPSVVRDVTDRFAVMKSGVIVEQGDTDRLFGSPRHDHTKELLGSVPDVQPDEGDDEKTVVIRTDERRAEAPQVSTAPNGSHREDQPGETDDGSAEIEAGADEEGAAVLPTPKIVDLPTPSSPPAATAFTMPRGFDIKTATAAADVAIAGAIASARPRRSAVPAEAMASEEPRIAETEKEPLIETVTPPRPSEAGDGSTHLHGLPPADEPANDDTVVYGPVPEAETLRLSAETDANRPAAEPEAEISIPVPPLPPREPESTPKVEPPDVVTRPVRPPAAAPNSETSARSAMIQGQNLIGGQWHDASDDRLLKVINPSDGEGIGYVARGTADDVDRAVTAARRALDGPWARVPAFERGRMLAELAKRVLENVDELAGLEVRDVGKPVRQAKADAMALARYFEFYSGAADKVHGQTIPYHDGYTVLTLREPHGVTGHIVPWNYPMQIIGRSVGAALAMGNACVLKPGEDASLTALEIGRLALEAGFPPGVLNVVTGLGEEAGAALAAHPGIDHLSFTGSVETGRNVQQAAAAHSCPVTLELGGKSPQIVFADADLDQALPFLVNGAIQNAGQTCSAGSRVLIQDWIYDELTHRLAERFDRLAVGPAERDLDCGPVINPIQKQRIGTYLDYARSERLAVLGEGRIAPGTPDGGYYVKPTLLGDVPADHPLAQEEIFGPVLSAIRFSSEEDAIRIANDSAYGLVAGIWTRDGARQMRLARAIKSGQIFINNYGAGGGIELPFGGVKSSGHGREKGFEALYGFSTLKTVAIRHG